MAIDLQNRLDQIKVKSGMLVERYKQERQQREQLQESVSDCERQIKELKQQIARLREENEMLKLNGLVNPSREDVENSRTILSKLVRDIDRCIADLTE